MYHLVGVATGEGDCEDHADDSYFFLASSTAAPFRRALYWLS
jgi:hypothetical protein